MKKQNTTSGPRATAPIQAVLNELLRTQESADIEGFSKCFAQDESTINIGTDIDEIWIGWQAFYNWMKEAIQHELDYTILEKDTRIFIAKSNDVAWYSQLLDTSFETKSDPLRIEGFRHTGVMEKRGDSWLIVQSHISVPDKSCPQEE